MSQIMRSPMRSPMKSSMKLSILALVASAMGYGLTLSACVSEADLDALDARYSIDGYDTDPTWYKTEVAGTAPGHGDSFRVIYANDIARSYGHFGEYPEGSLLVKDIFALDGEGPGELDYTAVMRKIAPDDAAAAGIELEGGWLFTFTDEARGDGEYLINLCWGQCHVQAPIDGAWYDYGLR